MANRFRFQSRNNGDIFAKDEANMLMGIWYHRRQEGTIRITDPDHIITTLERRGVSGTYVTKSLTEWLEILMKIGNEER